MSAQSNLPKKSLLGVTLSNNSIIQRVFPSKGSSDLKEPLIDNRSVMVHGFIHLSIHLLIHSLTKENTSVTSRNILPYYHEFQYTNNNITKELKSKYPKNHIVTSRFNIFNFLPKSLLEQFRRLANIYFLVIGIIAAIGYYTNVYETAIAPEAILIPMTTVILISTVKEGIEDFKRHLADSKMNAKLVKTLVANTGNINNLEWKDLLVGSIILLVDGDEVPADIVPLACGGIQGNSCYVETAAIDGESNLKVKSPCLPTDRVTVRSDKYQVYNLPDNYSINAEQPNSIIHQFNGNVEFSSAGTPNVPLSDKNLILRGSTIRATEWLVGIVVYTGAHTKLSLNSKKPPSKLSAVDRIVNQALAVAITVLLVLCVLSMVLRIVWEQNNNDANYLCIQKNDLESTFDSSGGGGCNSAATSSSLTLFTFLTLYNNMVCISMYVSMEVVYLFQAYFCSQDLNLYDSSTDTCCEVHSSSMCADLGQVQYVLSDKTGTLTKNVMQVKRCSVDGVIYGSPLGTSTSPHSDPELSKTVTNDSWLPLTDMGVTKTLANNKGLQMREFLRVMAACNTVLLMPDSKTGEVMVNDVKSLQDCLQAESPDEVALVLAAASCGNVILCKRENFQLITGDYEGRQSNRSDLTRNIARHEHYEILAVNSFDSFRKRMSILIKTKGLSPAKYYLLCKGADTSLLGATGIHDKDQNLDKIYEHIDIFAHNGLRTLVIGQREVPESEALSWLNEYVDAKNNITQRDTLLARCANTIENNISILGVCGIEDELQDEVGDAIEILRNAGLNVWILTGDKPETAIAISKMCNLITDTQQIEKVLGLRNEELSNRINELYSMLIAKHDKQTVATVTSMNPEVSVDSGVFDNIALILDDVSIYGALSIPDIAQKFTFIVQNIPTVVACRVSPMQKATLVRLVKTAPGKPVTLAIGDGANDVGMIHEARVGVGISGREGKHAANSADFAISQFKFLPILLFDHGRFNYIRCSKLVLYSFFKNLLLVSTLFYYSFLSGFSGTIPIDSLVFSGYNFYLGLPILALGAMDYDVNKEYVKKYPKLAYSSGRNGEVLNIKTMTIWSVLAFVEGLIICALVVRFIGGPTYYDDRGVGFNNTDGKNGGLFVDGFCLFTCCIISQQYKVLYMMTTRTWIHWFFWIISFVGYLSFTLLYGSFVSTNLFYQVVPLAFRLNEFWLAIFLIPIVLLIADILVDYGINILFPTAFTELLKQIKVEEKRKRQRSDGSLVYTQNTIRLSNAPRQSSSNNPLIEKEEIDSF